MQPYKEAFHIGSNVRVADCRVLKEFLSTWKYHNPLRQEQLLFAGAAAIVEKIGFYHGGDVLYVLAGIPGVWHEQCLRPGSDARFSDSSR